MKVILNDFIQHLGSQGDEVDVAPGYARNYLIPKKLAFEASDANRKTYENNLKQRARKIAKFIKEANEQKIKLEALDPLEFIRKTGEDGKLFGSVTSGDIEKAFDEHGFKIDKKRIGLARPIKSLGASEVKITIHSSVTGIVKLIVKPEQPVVAPVEQGEEETSGDQPEADDSAEELEEQIDS